MDESAGLIARTGDPAIPQTIHGVAGPPGFLGRVRIGRRIGLLAILAVLSLAGGGAAHIFGDMRLDFSAEMVRQNARIVSMAVNIDKGTAQMRRSEMEYIFHLDDFYIREYDDATAVLFGQIDEFEAVATSAEARQHVADVHDWIKAHIAKIYRLVVLARHLGYTEDEGFQGSMRRIAHALEAMLGTVHAGHSDKRPGPAVADPAEPVVERHPLHAARQNPAGRPAAQHCIALRGLGHRYRHTG